MKRQFPAAPQSLPGPMPELVRQLAEAWAQEPLRPRPSPAVLAHWDSLVNDWSQEPTLPLFVRKVANNRGTALTHASGREIVPSDNSPAHWSFALAVLGEMPSLDWVRQQLQSDTIPVAMILKASERATAKFKCSLGRVVNPNAAGWKVSHIDSIGLAKAGPVEGIPEPRLREHFIRFISPRNIFVIPTRYAGLGELPEFCDEIRKLMQPA
jgi:hypothetical protein